MNKVKPVPEGYSTVTSYLHVRNATQALEFYKKAFHAKELVRMPGPGGKIMHAEIQIGDSRIMLSDEFPEMGNKSPHTLGGTTGGLHLYVYDVDAWFKQAVAAGAQVKRPVENQFYGDRLGTLVDPFGHVWSIATHVENVSPEEMKKRMATMSQKK